MKNLDLIKKEYLKAKEFVRSFNNFSDEELQLLFKRNPDSFHVLATYKLFIRECEDQGIHLIAREVN